MPNINVYVSEAEKPLWEAARRVAAKHRISLNRVLADALRSDLRRADTEGPLTANEWADVAADAA